MQLPDKIALSPFVRIIVPLAVGIILSSRVTAPLWLVIAITAGVYGAAWLLRETDAGWWYVTAAVFVTGVLIMQLDDTQQEVPRGERLLMVVQIDDTPYTHGRWQRTTAHIGYFQSFPRRPEGPASSAYDPFMSLTPGHAAPPMEYARSRTIRDTTRGNYPKAGESPANPGKWVSVSEKIQLYIDTCYRIGAGEQITFRGYLNPIDTTGSSYGRLMRSRGMSAKSFLTPGALIARTTSEYRSAGYRAAQVQHGAVERIMRLDLSEADRNLVATLVAGERRGIDPKLRNDYAVTGVAHILSVSGLHMGFVLVIANLLLGWIVLFRRGHLIKNVLVILAMWSYAVVAGLSAPVVRAALMMSFAQLALGTSQRGNGYNLVLGAATLMLAIHPGYLYDVSFQLSFVAVLSILFFYPRLYRYRKRLGKIPNGILSCVMLGAAAQIGTLPLVAYSFGNIPLIALLINPIVILTSFVIISTGLLWLLLPLGILNPVCSFVIKTALWIQNGLIEWAAGIPVAAIKDVRMDGMSVLMLYAALGLLAVWIKIREDARTEKLAVTKKSRIFAR